MGSIAEVTMSSSDPLLPSKRREEPRLAIEFFIQCQREGHQGKGVFFIRNISATGFMFESVDQFTPGNQVQIEWFKPLSQGRQTWSRMRIAGRVVWANAIPGGFEHQGSNRYRMGLVFEQIHPDDQMMIRTYVQESMMMGKHQGRSSVDS